MLIEFRVENHRSLREEQVLSLEAASIGSSDDARVRKVAGYNKPLLTSAVIYGANASGKSNVLDAMAFACDAVANSHPHWDANVGIQRRPFAWGEARSLPSLYEVVFIRESLKFQYGFTIDDKKVCEEWLYAWPNQRKQVWFEREGQVFKFGDKLRGQNETISKLTRDNSLFLSAARQNNHQQLAHVYFWLSDLQTAKVSRSWPFRQGHHIRHLDYLPFPQDYDERVFAIMRPLLQAADLGIVDVRLREAGWAGETVSRENWSDVIQLRHSTDENDSWLNIEEESRGTQALFRYAWPIVDALETGGLLLIDELESSFHPLLALAVLNIFQNPDTNPNNAQLIFTTHDTNLLGTTLGEPAMRRDQVWFTEKDSTGATRLYPLTDYKPRQVENLERGYLQGRYGAIPFLGDLNPLAESESHGET
jgi:AAA15 family ATPase/GTPase